MKYVLGTREDGEWIAFHLYNDENPRCLAPLKRQYPYAEFFIMEPLNVERQSAHFSAYEFHYGLREQKRVLKDQINIKPNPILLYASADIPTGNTRFSYKHRETGLTVKLRRVPAIFSV